MITPLMRDNFAKQIFDLNYGIDKQIILVFADYFVRSFVPVSEVPQAFYISINKAEPGFQSEFAILNG